MRVRQLLFGLLVACGGPGDDAPPVDTDPDAVDTEPADTVVDSEPPDDTDDTGPVDLDRDDDGAQRPADCDDADPDVRPGAPELCNGVDDDCSGTIDDVAAPPGWWLDRDGDGFGDPDAAFASCLRPPAFVPAGGTPDCDDLDAAVFPGADELPGDGRDGDCDGVEACFDDLDADGFGAGPAHPGATLACDGFYEAPSGDDCDDDAFFVSPAADERCGHVDRDCDGAIGDEDDDAVDPVAWFRDGDGDGFGDAPTSLRACLPPDGYVADATDCADGLPFAYPGAPERCDLVDDDCDGRVDDADDDVVDPTTWHRDRDRDGYGHPTEVREACAASGDYDADDGDDCDDGLALRNPAAREQAGNTLDEDCDGQLGCFVDVDGDGLAGPTTAEVAAPSCATSGYGSTIADCDDADPSVTKRTFYADLDRDGFGSPGAAVVTCDPPLFYVADATDCLDTRRDVYPGAPEVVGDRVDQDCDGRERCPADADLDGHGGEGVVDSPDLKCDALGEAPLADDCDDDDPTRHPGATERLGDGRDADCDGRELCFLDADADRHGALVLVATTDLACAGAGVAPVPDDCDDADDAVFPGAGERCGTPDDDCDGLVDDADPGLVGAPAWFRDGDDDGLGAGTAITACLAPTGTVATAGDCADDLPLWGEVCPFEEVAVGAVGRWCARRTDDDLVCDGLGNPPVTHAQAMDVHGSLACAVADGAVVCWGTTSALDPRRDAPLGDFVDVDVGDRAACALDAAGVLTCWGDLGPPPAGTFVDVRVGAGTACALDARGVARCWGPLACDDLWSPDVQTLGVDGGVRCHVGSLGELRCEGCAPDDARRSGPPEPLLRFADVDVGPGAACAITATGDPTCWGAATQGMPGPGEGYRLTTIRVGDEDACGVLDDGQILCWGVIPP